MLSTSECQGPNHAATGLRRAAPDEEAAALRTLALCDRSGLGKLGVKGAGAQSWLAGQGIEVPSAIYDTGRLADGGLIARLGSADFFLEGGDAGEVLPRLSAELAKFPAQVYRVVRQDATFVLTGVRAPEVLAQMCSIDFRSAPGGRVCLTRVAGVNCMVLPVFMSDAVPMYRLWVDCTLAVSLWESLAEISGELGGRLVSGGWRG